MKVATCLFLIIGFGLRPQEVLAGSISSTSYLAGVHYDVISPNWKNSESEAVVYEFFSYMCPGCYAFEPIVNRLESEITEGQKIVRVPVALYPQWEPHAKAYFTLELMGELDRVHQALFTAIHEHKKQFRTIEDIAAWVDASFSIDEQLFMTNAQSFMVDNKMRKAQQMIGVMQVNSVPTLVVNGEKKLNFKKLKTPENIVNATKQLMDEG